MTLVIDVRDERRCLGVDVVAGGRSTGQFIILA